MSIKIHNDKYTVIIMIRSIVLQMATAVATITHYCYK